MVSAVLLLRSDMRALVFKLKKEFAPREKAGATTRSNSVAGENPAWSSSVVGDGPAKPLTARLKFQIYDDLTKVNFQKMKAIGADKRVAQCWSANGQIKFKLVGCQTVKSVKSVYDPIDDILG